MSNLMQSACVESKLATLVKREESFDGHVSVLMCAHECKRKRKRGG